MGRCSILVALVVFVFLLGSSCFKKPGPISVVDDIEPRDVQSGGLVTLQVSVTNMGGKVTIERIHGSELCVSGWCESSSTDLPLSNTHVAANATEVVYAQTSPVLNTGSDAVVIQNTVTVYSNGGDATGECDYTIEPYTTATQVHPRAFHGLVVNATR